MTNNTPDYEDNLYFDAQNKESEQQNDTLTEQWKKGELPEERYWVKIKTWCEYIDMLYYTSDIFLDGDVPVDNDKIIEVLAPVPSYDELQSMNEAVNQAMAANIKLVEQINRLKYLLKACRLSINGYPPYESGSEILRLTYRIDEVLK